MRVGDRVGNHLVINYILAIFQLYFLFTNFFNWRLPFHQLSETNSPSYLQRPPLIPIFYLILFYFALHVLAIVIEEHSHSLIAGATGNQGYPG